MAANQFTKEELRQIEEMAKVQFKSAATNSDDAGIEKFGKLYLRTQQIVAAADAPKVTRQRRALSGAQSAPSGDQPATGHAKPADKASSGATAKKGGDR